ncbi:hypothetical protein GGF42_007508, partial [Coemansia sp. RSA 2424]
SSDVGRGSLGRAATDYRLGRPAQPPSDSAAANSLRRKLTLPTATMAASNSGEAAGSATNEDLTSFFQNLLGRKGGATSSTTSSNGRSSPQQPPPRTLGGSLSRATGGNVASGQKEDQASLERWRSQLKRPKE